MPTPQISGLAALDPASGTPLYRQVYDRLRDAIAAGVLKPGERVPSVRALTKELGLSRGTVDAAYAQLAAEGYLQARGQAGTIVASDLPSIAPVAQRAPAPEVTVTATSFRPESIRPLQMGLPALDSFPRKVWARLGASCLRAMQAADMVHPAVCGLPELRTQIAAYLQVARGITCSPSQVFVTSGYRHTVSLIAEALLMAGDSVWIEDPGYPPTRELLERRAIATVAVPVDQEGMLVATGLARAPRARAAVVTPAHQSPLGVSLSLARRLALLEWARREAAWIIEDDYDGEYRYVSRPLPALKSLDHDGRVLYAGTFSKVLMPGIRLAYLVVPPMLVERFELVTQTFTGGSPQLTQAMVSAFIAQGHFARHIQRMRKLYAERRALAVAGLQSELQDYVHIDVQPGGMHLVLRLKAPLLDRDLVARILEHGLYAEALSDWNVEPRSAPGLLVGFTNIESRSVAQSLGRQLRMLIQSA
ncbi:PLP-dependent aminotransferase family protein [Pseudomonas sp. BJa5]|uniref:MocR-like pyridoxine biosynthesis transcription factor PdxR n=1 Tax=Pseudomonas sp. BJa5 TaxID=2936270 RepID=UPI00255A00E9|nr:PLP-dependent aminotransferase family protein [Pseudomonas sp. BGr12]MDL2421821.1 PLP-dependent aminotransferase family protein [Pseudomonas sp. BGr12]